MRLHWTECIARVARHMREDEHTAAVSSMDYLSSLSIFITSGEDRTVKVWDRNMTLIREMQFGEPVKSACFLNSRGDVLVGLSDGVSLVRVQDCT